MGDNDVICLSSDDEFAHDELPQKKIKNENLPNAGKIQPREKRTESSSCRSKRKSSDDAGNSDSGHVKKAKTEKINTDEITIESPTEAAGKSGGPSATMEERNGGPGKDVPTDRIRKESSISKISVKKSSELPQSRNSNSKETNGRINRVPKSRDSKDMSKKAAAHLVVNPVAKMRDLENSQCPRDAIVNSERKSSSERKDAEGATRADEATSPGKSRIDGRNCVAASISAADEGSNARSKKSKDDKPASCVTPSKVKDADNGGNTVNAATTSRTDRDNTRGKREDSRASPSSSPEVLILPETRKSKASSNACGSNASAALVSKSSNDTSKSEAGNADTESLACNDTSKSAGKSASLGTSCQTLNDSLTEDILSKSTALINGIRQTSSVISSMSTSADTTKCAPTKLGKSLGVTENEETVIRRITPRRMPSSARTYEAPPDEAAASSGEKTEEKKKDLESKPGADSSGEKKSSSGVSSLKRKSTSPDATKKRSKDDPQPGCSISAPDESDDKPRLVVFEKKPVDDDADDTFSAFLSLCLQTDRCDEMEKAVERLKHNYEQLNPAYRASKTFRNIVNQKRNAISSKGKTVVYHYMQVLKSEMKARKRKSGESKDEQENHEDAEEEESGEEARRINEKIKKIEKAMKECQKMIKKYEEAEVDFDDENNSQYMKLDRYKERMVELHTAMCKYTQEHPDAGRSYLRPKHLRVTQIPSIDQAINSFINSKLSLSKRKVAKGKSFVDGLIFPDYVDILECVEKVNEELKMNMTKRAMQNMAEKAFRQLGKHLQEARQNDYWDTFSLYLETADDPSTKDAELAEKLSKNRIIAEANEKKVFEEFVRRQEEGKAEDKDDSPSEAEDDDADAEKDEDEEDVIEKSNGDAESEMEMSVDEEDTDCENEKANDAEDEERVTANEAPLISHNNNNNNNNNNNDDDDDDVPSEPTTATATPNNSAETERIVPIEVTLADVDTEDGENDEPVEEANARQLLRIRSFAKPPEFWQSSQESMEKTLDEDIAGEKSQVLEITEDEVTVVDFVPGRKTVLQSGINAAAKTMNVVVSSTADATPISLAGRLVTIQAVNGGTGGASNKANGPNCPGYKLAPVAIRSVVPIASSARNNNTTAKIAAASRAQDNPPTASTTPVKIRAPRATGRPLATSTPASRAQENPPTASTTPVKIRAPRATGPPLATSSPAVRALSKPAADLNLRAAALRTRNNNLTLKIAAGPRPSGGSIVKIGPPVQVRPSSVHIRPTTVHIRPTTVQIGPPNGMQIVRVRGQYVAATVRTPNSTRFVTVPASLTPLQATSQQQPARPPPNTSQQIRGTAAASSSHQQPQPKNVQMVRLNGGKTTATRPATSSNSHVNPVVATVKVANSAAPGTTLPEVLKPRMHNVQTFQPQKDQLVKLSRPGDQSR